MWECFKVPWFLPERLVVTSRDMNGENTELSTAVLVGFTTEIARGACERGGGEG